MFSVNYWIWLQKAMGSGARVDELIARFGNAKGVYEAGLHEWRLSGAATPKQIENMSQTPLETADEVIKTCAQNGWAIITPESDFYPSGFKMMANYPLVLYVNGDAQVLKRKVCLSIVGTRQASRYGLEVTRRLSAQLASAGAVIVSGGALGIDSAAHTGAIIGNGTTVAFLGCGLKSNYLMENAPLRKAVSQNGAVVSEFMPSTSPTRTTFPIRNRLISGMSLGTVVIEAGERSGSLITARCALEQGRDVFAVPGNIISSAYTGANKLIREGAKPVFTAQDILEEYALMYPEEISLENADLPLLNFGSQVAPELIPKAKPKPQKPKSSVAQKPKASKSVEQADAISAENVSASKKTAPDGLTELAKKVYDILGSEPLHVDEIADKMQLNASDVLSVLTELELYDLVQSLSGRRYKLSL